MAKKDGKYGYVDKNNVVVVNYIYDDATEQNNSGYVAVKKDGKVYVQAGGGIVADSRPRLEYEESGNKARAVIDAIQNAGKDMTGGLMI